MAQGFTKKHITSAGSGGGGGQWELLSTTSVSGSPSELTASFDETAYDEIRIVLDQVIPATDGVSMYIQLSDDAGSTYFNTVNDYDSVERTWEGSGGWSGGSDTDEIRLLASVGSGTNESVSGSIRLLCCNGTDNGALVAAEMLFTNSVANIRAYEVKGFLDEPASVDGFRLYFASGNFENTGTMRVYGLKNT